MTSTDTSSPKSSAYKRTVVPAPKKPTTPTSPNAPKQTLAPKLPKPAPAPKRPALGWGKLALDLVIPLFICAILGLFFLGAFHDPTPRNVQMAVVGDSMETKVFAQNLQDEANGALYVRTISDTATAKDLVEQREIVAAYETKGTTATLYASSAASDSTLNMAQKIFMDLAFEKGQTFHVVDVVPAGEHDSTGQSLFYLLVALSIGACACVAPLAAFMHKVKVPLRFALAAAASAVVATIAVLIAAPLYKVIDSHFIGIWLLSWVYAASIILLGIGLHPLLRRWTTPALALLFIALNFTSSGGIFQPEMQPGFYGVVNAIWNGSGWLNAALTLIYFQGQSTGIEILRLILWLIPGAALIIVNQSWSARKERVAKENAKAKEATATTAA